MLVVAAVVTAVLAPALLAYLQLEYHADGDAADEFEAPTASTQRVLERAVFEASRAVDDKYA